MVQGPEAVHSFARLEEALPGRVGVALLPLDADAPARFGDTSPARAWSTMKVPVLVALLRARGAAGLTATERAWAELAITQSDNQAILDLFAALRAESQGLRDATAAVQELLRASGDTTTVVASEPPPPGAFTTFGQTLWAPGDEVRFLAALARGDLLPLVYTGYVLDLMARPAPIHRWGLGAADFPGRVAYKGGWGPEPDGSCLVRQSGLLGWGGAAGPTAVAVSVVAHPAPGETSFEQGCETVTRVARWLRERLAAGG